jgi:uncharacterized damage-inducible protein DinB
MSTPVLTAEEVLAWNDTTARKWHELIQQHPEILAIPCDVYNCKTVADLLQHIAAVELRYAQRLAGLDQTPYDQIPSNPASALLLTHQQAFVLFRRELATPGDWDASIEFQTLSRGPMKSTRKIVLFHALLHGIRHYAQLATLVRQHGIQPGWPMDYLFMGMQ